MPPALGGCTSISAHCARARDLNKLKLLAFIVVLFGLSSQQAAYAADTGVTVGVLAFRGDED